MNQSIPCTPAVAAPSEELVCVPMESEGAYWLKRQADMDISLTIQGYPHPLFDLFELLLIDRLLLDEAANSVMTRFQRNLLAQYCAYYHTQVRQLDDTFLSGFYDEFLTVLLEGATLITFQL